jgi:hypothetical protein
MSTDAVSTRIPIQRKDNWVQVTETVKTFATERMEAHLNLLSTDGDQRKNNALKREVRERIKRVSIISVFGICDTSGNGMGSDD